jgi:DNA-binding NtrC family response regulator
MRVLYLGADGDSANLRGAAARIGVKLWPMASSRELAAELSCERGDVILADYPPPGLHDARFLEILHELSPQSLVVFRMESSSPHQAVCLARQGAYSCCHRQTPAEELAAILTAALAEIESRMAAVTRSRQGWRSLMVGESVPMQDLARVIELVARRRCTVLITGETGTGKEVAARAIHMAGDRADRPMVAINCSAIPEHLLEAELFGHTRGAFTGAVNPRAGRFEEANHGTLFLDEIGDMPIDLQAKLLRVLQERELQRLGSSETIRVDVRVIAASNMDLQERVREGRFREDLYYRLNVVPLKMPPLRERRGDIRLLARHFVSKVCNLEAIPAKEIYNETLDRLMRYDWPGNVRQLENLVEKAVVLSGERRMLLPSDFVLPGGRLSAAPAADLRPFSVPDQGIDFVRTMTQFEKMILDQALLKANGNKTVAADLLRLKRTTLMSKLRVYEATSSARGDSR